jgi:hypothetical protein
MFGLIDGLRFARASWVYHCTCRCGSGWGEAWGAGPTIGVSPDQAGRPNIHQHLPTGFLNDLHSFDLTRMAWTLLTAAATDVSSHPAARYGHGFTAIGSKLYVHGGWSDDNGDGVASG